MWDLLIVWTGPIGLAAREAERLGLTAAAIATDALVMVEEDGSVPYGDGDWLVLSRPVHLLLAPEPVPRLLPIPGWTLPGVSTLADAAPRPGDKIWIAARRARLTEVIGFPAVGQIQLDEVTDFCAEGTGCLMAISFRDSGGAHRAAVDWLVLHDGTVPAVQQTRALGCDHQ